MKLSIRLLWIACASVAAMIFSAHPAWALSATLAATPTSYKGSCPATISFNGTIFGSANSAVSYYFGYYDPGQGKTIKVSSSGTTGPSGFLAVSASGKMTGSGTGSVTLYVTSPGSAQSNTVQISVTCIGLPSPLPTIMPPPGKPGIPAPFNLANTTDPKVCGQHIFPLICIAMSSGVLTLVWNWNPNASYQTLDGYDVYRVDHGMFTRVARTSAGQDGTGTMLQASSGPFNGTCYVARAYKGSTESASSNTFCVGGTGVIGPTTLYSTQWGWRYQDHSWQGIPYPGEGFADYGLMCTDVCMGWTHWETGSRPFGASENTYWRGYLMFDPNQISALHNVTSATLSIHVNSGNPGCFGGMAPATAQWIGNQNMVDGDFSYNVAPSINSSSATFNVTSLVKDWANGTIPNFGLVFKGNQENNDAYENNSCQLDFATSGVLTVHHF